jgi:alpha-ketoglutarate-dependent taurine dioxygenase
MSGKNVEDIYTLSPMQQGMLFEMLAARDTGMYLGQSVYRVQGSLDRDRFHQAWQNAVARHSLLRTAFLWEDLDKPVQVVIRNVDLPLSYLDWRDRPEPEQRAGVERLLVQDRRRGFDLDKPPLIRLMVIQTAADVHRLVWTSSHLVIDGWSEYLLLRDVFAQSAADASARAPVGEPGSTYRDYVAWLKRRNRSDAEAFWRRALAGFRHPTMVTMGAAAADTVHNGEAKSREAIELSAEAWAQLKVLARRHELTPNTVVQGAWAVLLSHHARAAEVMFGSVCAGRPPELSGVEAIVGLFVNTVPVRFCIDPREHMVAALRAMQRQFALAREYEYTLLTDIRKHSELPHGAPLFDSAIAFMKHWSVSDERLGGLKIEQETCVVNLSWPLALKVAGEHRLLIEAHYDLRFLAKSRVLRLLHMYQAILEHMTVEFDAPMQSYLDCLSREERMVDQTETAARRSISLGRLRRAKPVGLATAGAELIETDFICNGETCLPVIRPAVHGLSLKGWAARNRLLLNQHLLTHGGVLLRGFPVRLAADLGEFVQAMSDQLLEYRYRASPRTEMGNRIYSSTDYPREQSIFPHHEHAFCPTFPLRIYFSCLTPPSRGGETPVGNARSIFHRLDQGIRKRFSERRVMYMRNFGDGFGLSWAEVFGTSDRHEVEDYCRSQGITCEWKRGERLRTRYVGPAVCFHPKTGEALWFNHATFFHVTTLPTPIREFLMAEFRDEDLPNNTYYGDGSPIEAEVLEELRALYQSDLLLFPWQPGDVLFLDNMLSVHGRSPYTGDRKIVVGMSAPIEQADVAQTS